MKFKQYANRQWNNSLAQWEYETTNGTFKPKLEWKAFRGFQLAPKHSSIMTECEVLKHEESI